VKIALIMSVFCFHWLATLSAAAGDSPLYFDKLTKDKYILVVLRENGKAEFLHRETRSDGTIWLLHDDTATWGYFTNQTKNGRPNIWVKTKQFRFDYYLEDERLTEIDKMGVQNILAKRKNTKPDLK
jgi:hypothetical protein